VAKIVIKAIKNKCYLLSVDFILEIVKRPCLFKSITLYLPLFLNYGKIEIKEYFEIEVLNYL